MLFTSPHTVLCARWQPIYGYCTKWEREDNNTTAWENFILAVEKGPYMEASLRSPCELEVYVEALPPPHVHCCNRAAIYFYSETYHHMTSGTNLAKFAIPDNISLKVHYYASNLIKKRKKLRSTAELEIVCHFRWAMPSLTFEVTLAIIKVSHITVSRLN